MVSVREAGGAVELPLRVIPRAKKDEVAGERNGALCVRVTAPPVEGAANEAVCRLLSSALGVPRSAIRVTAGERARTKVIRVAGLDGRALAERLGALGVVFQVG